MAQCSQCLQHYGMVSLSLVEKRDRKYSIHVLVRKTKSSYHHLYFFYSKVKMKLNNKEVVKPLLQTINPPDCLQNKMVGYCKLDIR